MTVDDCVAFFDQVDSNGDGMVSQAEFTDHVLGHVAASKLQSQQRQDEAMAAGGGLTAREASTFRAKAAQIFRALDTNSDGRISVVELIQGLDNARYSDALMAVRKAASIQLGVPVNSMTVDDCVAFFDQ